MKPIDLDAVEKAVSAAEGKTSAEIIVAINRQSGSYLDRHLLVSVLGGLLLAEAIIVAPWWEFDQVWFVPGAAGIGFLLFAASRLLPPLHRLVTGRRRRTAQVALHARNTFALLNVSATRERNGLLVYLSLLEDAAVLLPDFGIEGKLSSLKWHEIIAKAGPCSASGDRTAWLCRLVEACGALLAGPFPPGPENPDELPNRPHLEVR
jgi:putative membrane protein